VGIHKTALVSGSAEIEPSVEIGPNVIIEGGVCLHHGVRVMANSYICSGTEIGEGTVIHMGAVIGNTPQDYAYNDAATFTKIGKNNIIREYVTIHRGTKEGSSTVIGDNNFLMVQAHVGHNCIIEDNVVIAPSALLAGYVEIGTGVFISGNVVFHQFCRIGRGAMIGGFTGVNKDVPPFMLVRGPSTVWGVNLVGLRRSGVKNDVIREIKEAYKIFFRSNLGQEEAITTIKEKLRSPEINEFISFIEGSRRGICKYRFANKEEYFD